VTITGEERDRLVRRGLWLAGLTISWNVIEAVVAVGAGLAAGSLALVAFGFDSMIEVLSAFVLAGYVLFESTRDLFFGGTEADTSPVGIVLASLSLVVMPTLGWAKRQTAMRLGSPTLRADAQETFLCAWLSAALLGGLALNAVLGWWWADPVAALANAAFAVKEGREAWLGDDDHGTPPE
jgi:divalent metal cation (Fe/Co/Zn/Cd) transporter